MQSLFNSKLNRTLVTIALAALVAALASYAYVTLKNAGGWAGPTTINITGNGEVTAIPDIATFSFAVRTEGKDAVEAQSKSAEVVNAVMTYLKEQGVAEKDIKTTNYAMNPKYRYDQKPCAYGMYCPPTEPVQDGFEASQMVEVKVRQIDTAGTLLAGVGERGATDVSGLGFTIDDVDALKAEARELAIADAKRQATELAAQLEVKLGDMVGYYEEMPYQPYYGGMGGDTMAKEAMSITPEVAVGENQVTSRVNLTYELK